MVEFHRQLKSQMANPAGDFSAARALREAALKLRRSERISPSVLLGRLRGDRQGILAIFPSGSAN